MRTTQANYCRWEKGDWGCDLAMVAKLAAALSKQPTDLMHEPGVKHSPNSTPRSAQSAA